MRLLEKLMTRPIQEAILCQAAINSLELMVLLRRLTLRLNIMSPLFKIAYQLCGRNQSRDNFGQFRKSVNRLRSSLQLKQTLRTNEVVVTIQCVRIYVST